MKAIGHIDRLQAAAQTIHVHGKRVIVDERVGLPQFIHQFAARDNRTCVFP